MSETTPHAFDNPLHPFEVQRQIIQAMARGCWLFILGKGAYTHVVQALYDAVPPDLRKGNVINWYITDPTGLTLQIVAFDPKVVDVHKMREVLLLNQMGSYLDHTEQKGEPAYFVPVLEGKEEQMAQTSQAFLAFMGMQIDPPPVPFVAGPAPHFTPTFAKHGFLCPVEMTQATEWLETGNAWSPEVRIICWMYYSDTGEFGTCYTIEHLDMRGNVNIRISGRIVGTRIDCEEARAAELLERQKFIIHAVGEIERNRVESQRSAAARLAKKAMEKINVEERSQGEAGAGDREGGRGQDSAGSGGNDPGDVQADNRRVDPGNV